jgi:hypothetical protein
MRQEKGVSIWERKSRPEKREEGEGKLGIGEEVEGKSGDR